MDNELERYQQDLLDSVRQMKEGKAARVTEVPLRRRLKQGPRRAIRRVHSPS